VEGLSRSSLDDGEDDDDVDDDDDNKIDDSSAGDDNNEGNNNADSELIVLVKVNELVLYCGIQIIVLKIICKVWV